MRERMNEANLAWDLAEHSRCLLSRTDRTRVFVRLGVGEYQQVIDIVLTLLADGGQHVPIELRSRLVRWVEGFAGHEKYPNRRLLLQRIAENNMLATRLASASSMASAGSSAHTYP